MSRTRRRRLRVGLAVAGLWLASCSATSESGIETTTSPSTAPPPTEPTTTTPTVSEPSTTTTDTTPGTVDSDVDPDGDQQDDLVATLIEDERALHDEQTPPEAFAAAARRQQLTYRAWSGHPQWDAAITARLPVELRADAISHLEARRLFIDMARELSDTIPAWEIVEPRPAEELLSYYQEAEAATGIEWEYLAAINLVETGMGRIRGLSTAGAQGPMQFLPSTFERWGEGGDIDDPRDAVLAAGRFLAHSAGPERDMNRALYRYNNHENYVGAVTRYAELMRDDPLTYRALWHWEIQYHSSAGDLWLPVGYAEPEPRPAADYAAANPDRVFPLPPSVENLARDTG